MTYSMTTSDTTKRSKGNVNVQDLKTETYYEYGGYPFRLLDDPSVLYETKYTNDGVKYVKATTASNPYQAFEDQQRGIGHITGIPVQFCDFDREGQILAWEKKTEEVYMRSNGSYNSVILDNDGKAMFPVDTQFDVIGTWDQYLEVYLGKIRSHFDRIEQEKIDEEERRKDAEARRVEEMQSGADRKVVRDLLGSLFGLYSVSNYDLPSDQVGYARKLLEKHAEVRRENIELFTIVSSVEFDSDDDEPLAVIGIVEHEGVISLDDEDDEDEIEDDDEYDDEDEDDEPVVSNRAGDTVGRRSDPII